MAKTLAQLQQEAEFWRREARRQLEQQATRPVTDEAVFNRMRQIGAGPILDAIKRKTRSGGNRDRERVILQPGGGQSGSAPVVGGGSGGATTVGGGAPVVGGGSGGATTVGGGAGNRNQATGGFNVQDFFQDFEDAMQDANEAQRERRDQLMEGHNQLMEDVVGAFRDRESQFRQDTEGFGSARAEQINRRFDRQGARAQANLVDRGLTASTVLPSVLRGVEEDRSLALNDLGERVQGLLLGQQPQLSGDTANALGQLGGNALRFIEAINETGPDFGQLAQLAQLLGAGNFGQGFGVPTGGGGSTGNQPQDLVGPVQGGTGAVGAPPASPTGFQTIPFGQFFGPGAMQNPLLGMMGQFFGAGQNAIQGNQGIVGGGSSQGPQGPLGFLTGQPLQPGGGGFAPRVMPQGGFGANVQPRTRRNNFSGDLDEPGEIGPRRLGPTGRPPWEIGPRTDPNPESGGPYERYQGGLVAGGQQGGSGMPSLRFPSLLGGGEEPQRSSGPVLPTERARRAMFQGVANPNFAGPASRMTLQRMQQMLQAGVPPTAIRQNMQRQAGAPGRGAPFTAPEPRLPRGGGGVSHDPVNPPTQPGRQPITGIAPAGGRVDLRRGRSRPRFNFMPG